MGKEIYPSATKAWNCSFPILFSLLPKRDHSALSKHVVRLLKKSKTKLHYFFFAMWILCSCYFHVTLITGMLFLISRFVGGMHQLKM